MLRTTSPFNLKAVAIARAASTSSATLYVYFKDVEDLMFALSVEASNELVELVEGGPEDFWKHNDPTESARSFIERFNSVWDCHSNVLLYRNLEADRGNERFLELRTRAAIPIIKCLAAIPAVPVNTYEEGQSAEVFAEAVVLYAAVERLAASKHQYPAHLRGLDHATLNVAQARIIARSLSPVA